VDRRLGSSLLKNVFTYYPWTTANGQGRLQSLYTGLVNPPKTAYQNLAYSYDAVGNVKTILEATNANQKQCFTYDALDQLTKGTTSTDTPQGCTTQLGVGNYDESYAYDSSGRLSSKTGLGALTYLDSNHVHAVTHIGGVQKYWHDPNGNQVTRIVGGNTYTLVYDAENRLASVTGGGTTATFTYNGDGQRVKSVVGATTTVFIGNYYELSGSTTRKYYYAGNVRVALREGSNLYYLAGDHLGSTSLSYLSSGTSTQWQRYKPWGENRSGTLPTKYHFTGQYHESSVGGGTEGLYYYGSRWLDPSIMRWTSPDSIIPDSSDPIAFDRYAYSRNNPVRYTDPSGHSWWDVIGQFATGFVTEFARTNSWYYSPAQEALAVNQNETDVMLAGRVAADVVAIGMGVVEFAGGLTIAAGGTVAGCATTLCAASPAAVVAGAGVAGVGAATATAGAVGLGGNLALLSGQSGSGVNHNQDPWQVGDPINKPTANGYPSWSTVQRRYWQNRAQNALPGEFSAANLKRMKNGLPPLHEEYGVPMELHHINGRDIPDPHNIYNLREVWPWEHDTIDPYRYYRGPQPR
jgi:RHS repeat-associated protein